MSKKIAIVLELTQSEAETLSALVRRGISWSFSGRQGKDAEAIDDALSDVDVLPAQVYAHDEKGVRIGGLPRWLGLKL
jgi:hypothetical protein